MFINTVFLLSGTVTSHSEIFNRGSLLPHMLLGGCMKYEHGVRKHPNTVFLFPTALCHICRHTHTRARKHTRTQSTAGHARRALCDALAPAKKKNADLFVRIRRDRAGHRDGVSLPSAGPVQRKPSSPNGPYPNIHGRTSTSPTPPQRSRSRGSFRSSSRR